MQHHAGGKRQRISCSRTNVVEGLEAIFFLGCTHRLLLCHEALCLGAGCAGDVAGCADDMLVDGASAVHLKSLV